MGRAAPVQELDTAKHHLEMGREHCPACAEHGKQFFGANICERHKHELEVMHREHPERVLKYQHSSYDSEAPVGLYWVEEVAEQIDDGFPGDLDPWGTRVAAPLGTSCTPHEFGTFLKLRGDLAEWSPAKRVIAAEPEWQCPAKEG